MAGARRRRKDERTSEILDAAFEEFSATGFSATRLDDIAARAGITKGTIYVYFKDKEDLFIAMLKQTCLPTIENIDTLSKAPKGPALEILRVHFGFAADRLVNDRRGREAIRMLMAEGPRFPAIVDVWHAEVVIPFLTAFDRIIVYGVARGEFRPLPASVGAQLLLAPFITASQWLIMFGDRHPLDVRLFLETSLGIIAQGLAPAPPDPRNRSLAPVPAGGAKTP